jgi:hypothetical protein
MLALSNLSTAELDIPEVRIAGEGIPQPVNLSPPDADAFRRRINAPPELEEAPSVSGRFYIVSSKYWNDYVRPYLDEDEIDLDEHAFYYPEGGYVRTTQDGEDVWVVLDLRQRAILNRYIRLAGANLIDQTPSSIGVLHASYTGSLQDAAAGNSGDLISLEVAGRALTGAQADQVWQALLRLGAASFLDPVQPPRPATTPGFWLLFYLPEGRSLQYFYDGTSLIDMLGSERYDATAVRGVLDPLAPQERPVIQHQEPTGSLLWWPLMFGGGLVSLALAIVLRRRQLAQ